MLKLILKILDCLELKTLFTFTATVKENIFTTETKIRLSNKNRNLPGLRISFGTPKHTNRMHGIKYIWKLYSAGELLK